MKLRTMRAARPKDGLYTQPGDARITRIGRFLRASRFDELVEHTRQRWQRSGEIAHRAEPDLKTGRGGLRDVQ